jgi:hypothetical protein
MTPVPATWRSDQVMRAKVEEAVAHCNEAVRENERVVDTIEELLNAGDSGRPCRRESPSR